MKLRIFIIILILLFSVATSFALVDKDQIVADIAKSIKEHPEQWIDTGSRFIHCENPDKMKELRKMIYPELEANLALIYNFYNASLYIFLDKPFEYSFKGDKLKELMQEIKLYKLKVLQKEVGHLLKRKEVPKKKLEKKEIIEEGGLKKL